MYTVPRKSRILCFFLFSSDKIHCLLKKKCNLLNYADRKLCLLFLLSSDAPLTCEKYLAPEFLLKIDLWLYVAKDAWVHYPGCFSAKWNNGLLQWLCTQRIFTSSLKTHKCTHKRTHTHAHTHTHTHTPTCSTLHNLFPMKRIISMSATTSRFKGMLANLFTSGEVAWGKTASGGGERTLLLSLSVSIMWDLRLMYLVYSTDKLQLLRLWKYLRKKGLTTFMLIKAGNVLWWCGCVNE